METFLRGVVHVLKNIFELSEKFWRWTRNISVCLGSDVDALYLHPLHFEASSEL